MKNRRETPNYLKIVEWSEEDGCFVGSAPPLLGPSCHGTDEVRVYRELCQIVEEWIAIFKKDGTALPPALDKKKFGQNLETKLLEWSLRFRMLQHGP